jgi:hypothetical protein
MIIDLKNTETFYINIKKHQEKNESMIDLGNKFGFKKYNRIDGIHKPKDPLSGCAASHYKILSELKDMAIILEDDCIIKNNISKIEVPDDADAVYLGLSQWGYQKDSSRPGNFTFTRNGRLKDIYKVDSMLATHAILYISKRYIDACTAVAKYSEQNSVHIDQGFARIQRYYNIYALGNPIFYQNSNKDATNISFVKNKLVHNNG